MMMPDDGQAFVKFAKFCLAHNMQPWDVMCRLLAHIRTAYDAQTDEMVVASQFRMPVPNEIPVPAIGEGQ